MTETGVAADAAVDDVDDDHQPRTGRRRRRVVVVAAAAVLLAAGVGVGLHLATGTSAPKGPEGVELQNVPDLASADSTASGAAVDGITCRKDMDQVVINHVHAHVAIFVDGAQRRIPAGAGITAPRTTEQLKGGRFVDNGDNGCLYWLHVHADDGIVHVEAPVKQTFTLGQFFDVWGQPLDSSHVGPAEGHVTAYVGGKVFTGDPRDIPLSSQAAIQLDVGTPVVPFRPLTFTVNGLCSAKVTTCTLTPPSSAAA